MAIKFSQFVVKTIQSDVDYIVGYKGADNVQITPSDFLSASLGAYLPLAGGTMTGNVIFNDGVKALFGTGSDMEVFHNGTSYIQNNTGTLRIIQNVNDGDIQLESDDGSGGLATYLTIDGSDERVNFFKNAGFSDNVKAFFGSGLDLRIYHDGSNSYIQDNGTGNLSICGTQVDIMNPDASEYKARFLSDGAVELYHDNTKKFETTSTGVTITGVVVSDGLSMGDNEQIRLGDGEDLRLFHNGTDSSINNYNGDLYITNQADDKDIIFRTDDGTGGFTEYFKLDGSIESLVASKDLLMAIDGNGGKIKFGASQDLQIYHDGSHSYVEDTGTGQLRLKSDSEIQFLSDTNDFHAKMVKDGAVELYYDNSKKFETTSTGIDVTGTTDTDNLTIAGAQGSSGDVLTSTGSGVAWQAGGGGGATDLNGLSDCLVDGTSVYVSEVPGGLSGNPVDNTILGIDAGDGLTTGFGNTFLGFEAGKLITDSDNMVLIGRQAGNASASNGDRTVAIGYDAYGSSISTDNVAVGYAASQFSGVNFCVAVGRSAAIFNSGAQTVSIGPSTNYSNSAIGTVSVGYEAGRSQTSGTGNTNVGYKAGYGVTTSVQNTIIGYEAGMDSSLLAGGVVAIGYQAGKEFEIGDGAVLVGRHAGAGNGSAKQETVFIGDGAGRYISSAFNTAVGAGALRGGTSGGSAASYNTAIGRLSLYQITTGDFNVAVGANSGGAVSTGGNNTLIGYEAGESITESPDNTFVGYQAGTLYNNTSGDGRNVGVGSVSAGALTTGIYNTFVGYGAGNGGGGTSATVTTGNFNTMVGYQAKGSATSASNQNSFGYSAACTANNQVTLGDTNIVTIRAAVTSITAISDERDKTDIETLPYGLDFVNSLQPRKFVWDNRAETDGDGNEFFSSHKGKKDIGFIAQELQTVDDDYLNLVYDANPEKLEATYGRLIPVLVKAIQDLSAEVKELKVEVDALKAS